MEGFSICYNLFLLVVQGAMHISFSGRLAGKKTRAWHFAVYTLLLCLLDVLANQLSCPWFLAIGAGTLLLYGVNRFLLGNRSSLSWAAAILAHYISQLSFGLLNSVEAVLLPHVVGTPLLYLLLAAATAASYAVCALCYRTVVKTISPKELAGASHAACLLFPILFFFTAELYIMQTSYTQSFYYVFSSTLFLEYLGRHTALLVLQALGLGALFCTLYAYRYLCRSLEAEARMRTLSQAAEAQKRYVAEARMRYEGTKAFRHDIKNHLSVLNGLLNSGKLAEGREYLQKLESASVELSFPCQTGNPVVDILLGEKLGLAKADGIEAEISLCLPKSCGADDFDLCVIFANALDNAIHACQEVEGERRINITGGRQGDFYLLAFENTCSEEPLPPEGTGLSNIRSVAEKYHGAVGIEKMEGHFLLHVLLNLSIQGG